MKGVRGRQDVCLNVNIQYFYLEARRMRFENRQRRLGIGKAAD